MFTGQITQGRPSLGEPTDTSGAEGHNIVRNQALEQIGPSPRADHPERQQSQGLQRRGFSVDRQRRYRWIAYLGCAGALGYGVMKVIWALGGTIGISNPGRFHDIENGLPLLQRFFDYWGTPILAGFAVVVLLGLVYPWGNLVILRPLLRGLAWAGSLLSVVGVGGLILTISGTTIATSGGDKWGWLDPGTYLFTYACFLVLGLAFGATAWLTRRRPEGVARSSASLA